MFKRNKKNAFRLRMFNCAMHWLTVGLMFAYAYSAANGEVEPSLMSVLGAVVLCSMWGFWFSAWLAAVEIHEDIAAEEREKAKK